MGSAVIWARCRGGPVLFSDEVDPKCAESETDFLWILAHVLNQALILENRQLLSKGPPTKTTTTISQLVPTKPLIAGIVPDLSGSLKVMERELAFGFASRCNAVGKLIAIQREARRGRPVVFAPLASRAPRLFSCIRCTYIVPNAAVRLRVSL